MWGTAWEEQEDEGGKKLGAAGVRQELEFGDEHGSVLKSRDNRISGWTVGERERGFQDEAKAFEPEHGGVRSHKLRAVVGNQSERPIRPP